MRRKRERQKEEKKEKRKVWCQVIIPVPLSVARGIYSGSHLRRGSKR
jgi:hypothetical protein